MNGRRAVAWGVAVLLVLPLGIRPTTASWNDREWAHTAVGTTSLRCGTDTGFASTAEGRFLTGGLLGNDLDPIADLEQLTLALDDSGVARVVPPTASPLASAPPTYANPFDVELLGGVAAVDLTGLAVPLPGAELGAANQYARVTADGAATGASGLVNDSGAVLVDEGAPGADLPAEASVSLNDLLPAAAEVTGVDLRIGAVGASSTVDGCSALRSLLWEDGSVSGVTRDYGIAGLGLDVDSPAVAALTGSATSGVSGVASAVGSLLGPSGLISRAIGSRLDLALPGVLTTSVGGRVTLAGLDLGGALTTLLTTPLTDDVVTIDLQTGAVAVDLDALLPPLNDAPPNTEIVVDPAVVTTIVARIAALLDRWTGQVTSALTSEIRDAVVTIDLAAVIAAPGISVPPLLTLPGLDVLNVGIDYVGPVGALLDGTAAFSLDVDVAGAVGAISTLLSALGLPTVADLTRLVSGLGSTLVGSVANTVTTTAIGAVTTLGATLTAAVAPVVSALGGLVGALPQVLSIMVNVQPDLPGAPPGTTFTPGTAVSTPEYMVSALRIGLADHLAPGDVASVTLATASAGPVFTP
jgi:hypothetical protein